MTRLAGSWRALDGEQRLAAGAAIALLLAMFLPWYGLQSENTKTHAIYSHSINAFGDVSFVEAAIFLVAAGVIAMLFARGDGRDFKLPGGDGTIVLIAGVWAAVLIFVRVFSRPPGNGYPVGIEWGFFVAFVAAGVLGYAGWRMRAATRPEPPLRRPRSRHERTRAPSFAGETDPTEPLARREPGRSARASDEGLSEGDHGAREAEALTAPVGARRRPATAAARERAAGRAPSPPAPAAPPEQLSFEDPPAHGD